MDRELYLDLLKKVLIDYHRTEQGEYKPLYANDPGWKLRMLLWADKLVSKMLKRKEFTIRICQEIHFTKENREEGKDWPTYAESMIGLKRMDNIEFCMKKIIADNIPGDVIETGVWRGGATIFMRAILKANNIQDRNVWVADSFVGLPEPNVEKYSADAKSRHHAREEIAASETAVKRNFEKFGLLDDKVKFLKGWFKDTLPTAPIKKLALMRLDGDMYESTMDALVNLYPKLSPGGYVIIDDWGAIKACRKAVEDYRGKFGITDEIIPIDWTGVYWRKER